MWSRHRSRRCRCLRNRSSLRSSLWWGRCHRRRHCSFRPRRTGRRPQWLRGGCLSRHRRSRPLQVSSHRHPNRWRRSLRRLQCRSRCRCRRRLQWLRDGCWSRHRRSRSMWRRSRRGDRRKPGLTFRRSRRCRCLGTTWGCRECCRLHRLQCHSRCRHRRRLRSHPGRLTGRCRRSPLMPGNRHRRHLGRHRRRRRRLLRYRPRPHRRRLLRCRRHPHRRRLLRCRRRPHRHRRRHRLWGLCRLRLNRHRRQCNPGIPRTHHRRSQTGRRHRCRHCRCSRPVRCPQCAPPGEGVSRRCFHCTP